MKRPLLRFVAFLALGVSLFGAAPPQEPKPCCQTPTSRAAVFAQLAQAPPPAPAAEPRPNLIFLLADDLRYDLPAAQTPHLDALAAQGYRFQNHFVTTSICCVSRASILSGQYQRRHGIGDFKTPFTEAAWNETYPALLRAAGYRTGFIGKFGVGDAKAIKARAANFDFWRGLPGQGAKRFIDPQDPTRTHETARMGNEALEFLTQPSAQPFCLSVSFSAPHARDNEPREFEPDPCDEALYADQAITPPPTAAVRFFELLPPFMQRAEGRKRWEKRFSTPTLAEQTTRDYLRLVTGIDREVGRIVQTLRERNLLSQTVIIFTSDNGFALGDRGLSDKWHMYEESIRVPLLILDGRRLASQPRPPIAAMTLNLDAAPTLLSLAGVPVPQRMQGQSLLPLLASTPPTTWRTEFFYEHLFGSNIIPPVEGVRTANETYLRWLPPNPEQEELYDLTSDPLQERNLAHNPAAANALNRLRSKWQLWREQVR